jgi:hypothetical protein
LEPRELLGDIQHVVTPMAAVMPDEQIGEGARPDVLVREGEAVAAPQMKHQDLLEPDLGDALAARFRIRRSLA